MRREQFMQLVFQIYSHLECLLISVNTFTYSLTRQQCMSNYVDLVFDIPCYEIYTHLSCGYMYKKAVKRNEEVYR